MDARVDGGPTDEVQRRFRFLSSASAALAESLDYQRTLQRVAELAVPDIADWCTVTVIDGQGAVRRLAVVHADPAKRELAEEYQRQFPPDEHRSGQLLQVLERGTASLAMRVTDEDLVRASQSPEHLRIMRALGTASCVIVPMVARGEILGVISLMRGVARAPYNDTDVEVAEQLANRAALAVDNARLFRETRRREETMRFFAEASTLLSSSLDHVSICERLAALVVPSFADWCGVEVTDDDELHPIAIAHVDPTKVEVAREMRRRYPPDSATPSGPYAVVRSGRPELVNEISDDMLIRGARNQEHLNFIRNLGLRSVLIVPLVARGRALGVLNLVWAESGRQFTPEDLEVMQELGRRAGLAIDNARLYDEARSAVKLRDEFLSIASHELKTPLTSLRLKVDSIHRITTRGAGEAVDLAKLNTRVQALDKQLDRLSELVDALLDVSRASAGQLTLKLEDVDLTAVVTAAGERFKDDLASAGCSLSIVVTGPGGQKSPIVGRWDRLRLDEIVTNFLSNAVKYGGGKPIQLRVSASDAVASIEVEDHGIGISDADQERLFKRFARVASPEHYGGFGLGLWIVKVLVEAMRGRVSVRSAVGRGSVFVAELPRQPSTSVSG